MTSSFVELRPDRRLIDHEFEGYKLNLQALPHYVHKLDFSVYNMQPNEAQYSFVHAKLFAYHNHLVLDHWDYTFSYYYVDFNRKVHHITFESTNNTFKNTVVFENLTTERKPGHYNVCLSFPSNNLAVLSDGTGYLHILDTGNRNRPAQCKPWQTLHSSLLLGEDIFFVIVDSRMQEKNNTEVLHILIQSVEQIECHHYSVLSWITFEYDDSTWKQMSLRQIRGKGIIHYAAIESTCTAIYIASDNPFQFIADSETPIAEKKEEEPTKTIYTWLQTSDDITITLKLQPNFDKQLLHVNVSPLSIKVSYAGNEFVNGTFKHKVDSELTTWHVEEDGKVDILVTKSETMIWDDMLTEGDPNGKQIMDASLVEEAHRRLAHLCSETPITENKPGPGLSTQELEECDAPSEEDTVLVRFDVKSHEITHRVPLSVHQYLFSIKLETHEVPALALRHDVDACVWQPYAQLINSNVWPVKHQGTLMAFGYIQSSKQNRKFITCPPNFSYSVVCEAKKHVFVYKSSHDPDSHLKKRTGGVMKTIKVGQQHVFNIDKYGEILGVNATNEYLFILTSNSLIALAV